MIRYNSLRFIKVGYNSVCSW